METTEATGYQCGNCHYWEDPLDARQHVSSSFACHGRNSMWGDPDSYILKHLGKECEPHLHGILHSAFAKDTNWNAEQHDAEQADHSAHRLREGTTNKCAAKPQRYSIASAAKLIPYLWIGPAG